MRSTHQVMPDGHLHYVTAAGTPLVIITASAELVPVRPGDEAADSLTIIERTFADWEAKPGPPASL